MSETRELHRVLIVNREGKEDPYVSPEVLGVARRDRVVFVVVGETGGFWIEPHTDLYKSVSSGENVPIEYGSSRVLEVRQDIKTNTVHKYDVRSESYKDIDPIIGIIE